MKIMSLNINAFMGLTTKVGGKGVDGIIRDRCQNEKEQCDPHKIMEDFDDQYMDKGAKTINAICAIIESESPEIVILQEYRANFPSAKRFKKLMIDKGYKGPLTHQSHDEEKDKNKFGFSTAFYVKNGLSYKDEKELPQKLSIELNDRVYSIGVGDIIIIGIHIPLNNTSRATIREDTWDEVLTFFKHYSNKKIIIIGDFNTYDNMKEENKKAYAKKQQMIENNVVDLWTVLGNNDATPTQKPYKMRLDYAFKTTCINNKINMRLIPEEDNEFIKNWDLSDHRMLIVEIEEDQNE